MKIQKVFKIGVSGCLIFFLTYYLSCKSNEAEFKNEDTNYKISLVYLMKIRDEGNCMRSEKKDNGTSVIYCDRKPSGLCNESDLIYSTGDRNTRLNEISEINKKTSECSAFILQAGLVTEQVTTESEENTIKSKNTFKNVDLCENSNISGTYNSLFTKEDLKFINSTKGKIAIKAEAASISSLIPSLQSQGKNCLDLMLRDELTLKYDENKKKILEDLRTSIKVKNISCTLGDISSATKCPDSVSAF